MAEQRRMFSGNVLNTDEFSELPQAAKVLYFFMNMEADDYGFLKCVKQLMRLQNARPKDLEALKAAGLILCFDSGAALIRHWHVHNCIRPDRKRDTAFKDEQRLVTLNESRVYVLKEEGAQPAEGIERENAKNSPQPRENQHPLSVNRPPDDGQMSAGCQTDDGQTAVKCPHSTGKVSTGKVSTEKESTGERSGEEDKKERETGLFPLSSSGDTFSSSITSQRDETAHDIAWAALYAPPASLREPPAKPPLKPPEGAGPYPTAERLAASAARIEAVVRRMQQAGAKGGADREG